MSLHESPRSKRLHIGFFGPRNAGKSSLVNSLAGHKVALVSEFPGTTTDPVYKSMEIAPLGPCVLVDTAGFDDEGELGGLRVERTVQALEKTDLALLVFSPDDLNAAAGSNAPEASGLALLKTWAEELRAQKVPLLLVLNKADLLDASALEVTLDMAEAQFGARPLAISAKGGLGRAELLEAITRLVPADWDSASLTGKLAKEGDLVLLVMPQDIQAPKGRLILPQVQVMRDLLDKKCLIMSTVSAKLEESLAALSRAPDLIITDSQVFPLVYAKKPESSLLTSFSILLAGHKGDMDAFKAGAAALGELTPSSRVLIAEACTHAPLAEDIGREKIPAMLRQRVGEGLTVDVVSGTDFPKDLFPYDVIIHCGACMFNRRYMMGRVDKARQQQVPMTNYGVALAWLGGILDKVVTA